MEIQITCLSDTSVVRYHKISRSSILPLGPIWVNVILDNIIRRIENDDKVSKDFKDDFIDAYNNIPNKTKIQFHNEYYREYVMDPIKQYYIEKKLKQMTKNLL